MKRIAIAIMAVALIATGCNSAADVASSNLSKAAEQFEIERRIVFYNGITDAYILVVEGRCSIEDADNQLEVTCRVDTDEYMKHYLGLSDNVSYFAEQLETVDVDEFHYRVFFRPEAIVPNIDLETSGNDG